MSVRQPSDPLALPAPNSLFSAPISPRVFPSFPRPPQGTGPASPAAPHRTGGITRALGLPCATHEE
ncbi:hypothetical protein GCM10010357_11890 [Streptomyces luteireticuli]|uniref:Uncharacterized protein n=1 Tax=Streptomyces luteireticuli TaxID=173858 RepID=A0ABN0YED1_9ACTN